MRKLQLLLRCKLNQIILFLISFHAIFKPVAASFKQIVYLILTNKYLLLAPMV